MTTAACTIPGLADLPPGPELGTLLAAVDLSALSDGELIEALQAWSRQHAHAHARMLRTITEIANRSRAALARPSEHATIGDWASVEIATALTWTDGKAG